MSIVYSKKKDTFKIDMFQAFVFIKNVDKKIILKVLIKLFNSISRKMFLDFFFYQFRNTHWNKVGFLNFNAFQSINKNITKLANTIKSCDAKISFDNKEIIKSKKYYDFSGIYPFFWEKNRNLYLTTKNCLYLTIFKKYKLFKKNNFRSITVTSSYKRIKSPMLIKASPIRSINFGNFKKLFKANERKRIKGNILKRFNYSDRNLKLSGSPFFKSLHVVHNFPILFNERLKGFFDGKEKNHFWNHRNRKESAIFFDCKFPMILSKNWTFPHEILVENVSIVVKKKESICNFKLQSLQNFQILEKNCIRINNSLYFKIEMLGKGGSSKVYKILRHDKKLFALKRIKFGQYGTQIINNFVNEITILKLLRGKSRIIQIEDAEVNFIKKSINIILEFGEFDLEFLYNQKKRDFSKNYNLKFYWKQILEAVKEIHDERIVHGDLKPGNFLIIKNNLKLIDFGISKPIGNNTTNITRDIHVGTLNYMSPEAILEIPGILENIPRFKTSRSSDIWSLGCILFQLTQGHPPFKDFSMIQKIHAIVNNTLKINYLSELKSLLIDIIENCLKRHPDFRPTILELLDHPFLSINIKI